MIKPTSIDVCAEKDCILYKCFMIVFYPEWLFAAKAMKNCPLCKHFKGVDMKVKK